MSQQTIANFRDSSQKGLSQTTDKNETKQSTQLWVNWKKNGSK